MASRQHYPKVENFIHNNSTGWSNTLQPSILNNNNNKPAPSPPRRNIATTSQVFNNRVEAMQQVLSPPTMISENDSSSGNRNTTTSTLEKSKNNSSSQTNSSTSCNNATNGHQIHPQLTNQLLQNANSTYTFQHSTLGGGLLPTSGYIPGIGIPQNCPNTPTLQNVQKFLTYNPSEISINNQNNTMTIPKFYSSPSVAAAAKVRHGTHSDSHAYYLESKNHGYDEGGRFCGVRVKCSKKTVYLASMICLFLFILQLGAIGAITLGWIKLPGAVNESGQNEKDHQQTYQNQVNQANQEKLTPKTQENSSLRIPISPPISPELNTDSIITIHSEPEKPVNFYEDVDFSEYYEFSDLKPKIEPENDQTASNSDEIGDWSEWTTCANPCHERTRSRTCGKSCIDNTRESCHYSMKRECGEDQEMKELSDTDSNFSKNSKSWKNLKNSKNSKNSSKKSNFGQEPYFDDTCTEMLRLDKLYLKKRREDLENLPSCPCSFPKIDGSDMKASVKIDGVRWLITNTEEPLPNADMSDADLDYNVGVELSSSQAGSNFVDARLLDANADMDTANFDEFGLENGENTKNGENSKNGINNDFVENNSKISTRFPKNSHSFIQKQQNQQNQQSHAQSSPSSPSVKCIRSIPPENRTLKSSNTCCYDNSNEKNINQLITRGPAAGMPSLISPDYNYTLHYQYDVLPYLSCHGNWFMYHKFRQPNNGADCREFPGKRVFRKMKKLLREEYNF